MATCRKRMTSTRTKKTKRNKAPSILYEFRHIEFGRDLLDMTARG